VIIARRFKNILSKEINKKGIKVLDVGGPTHKLYDELRISKSNLYYLNLSKKRAKTKKGRPAVLATACIMPFQNESFDVVMSHNVFEHINEPWLAAEECVRVCKKGGLLIHSTCFSWRHHDAPDYYRYSHQGLAYLFERTGNVTTIWCDIGRHKKKQVKGAKWREYWKTVYEGRRK
jgi:ubiquinone/menaquinone biosynthesis C-methylase UbiE